MFIVGHRGARAHAPENTQKAIRIGMKCAEYVEVDVRLSLDRVPVVMHDPTVDRTTDGKGRVGEMTFDELSTLDAGEGEHVPSLQEVCELVKGECGLFVEIKEPGSEMEVCAVLDREAPSPLWVVSFHSGSLEIVSEILPGAVIGFIYSRQVPGAAENAARKKQHALLPRFDLLVPELVGAAHARGIRVVPWTPNTAGEWEMAREIGVDGVATDDPCSAREWNKTVG
ncbi:MAG: glycerophosphodiester phosphodiesterase [Methanolinea sp.]|jgi:glycerophosphoryl diester phosphodiesterase|nr:glycerophosphodiester phosphodiesterase [Methanolinea sp.]